MRSNRHGFTLLELGIAVAVMGVLAAIITTGLSGWQRIARSERTAKEVSALLGVAVSVAMRDLQLSSGCTVAGGCTTTEPLKTFRGVDLTTGPVCFDLGCASAGCAWNGISNGARPRDAELVRMAGWAEGAPGAARNPYGAPYALCVFRRRVAVATCMPAADVPAELGGAKADDCSALGGTFTCAATEKCVSSSMTLATPTLTRLAMRQKFLYWGEATDP